MSLGFAYISNHVTKKFILMQKLESRTAGLNPTYIKHVDKEGEAK